MITDKQIAANRANAAKSTGPRTPAGKARAVRNAFTLGLTTDQLLAPSESRGSLARHATALHCHFAPATPVENLLVDRIIAASWRLRRTRIIETRVYHQRTQELDKYLQHKSSPCDPLTEVFRRTITNENCLQRLALDESRLERSLYRALKELNASKIATIKNRQIEPNSDSPQLPETPPDPPQNRPSQPNPFEPNPIPIQTHPSTPVSATLSQEPQQ